MRSIGEWSVLNTDTAYTIIYTNKSHHPHATANTFNILSTYYRPTHTLTTQTTEASDIHEMSKIVSEHSKDLDLGLIVDLLDVNIKLLIATPKQRYLHRYFYQRIYMRSSINDVIISNIYLLNKDDLDRTSRIDRMFGQKIYTMSELMKYIVSHVAIKFKSDNKGCIKPDSLDIIMKDLYLNELKDGKPDGKNIQHLDKIMELECVKVLMNKLTQKLTPSDQDSSVWINISCLNAYIRSEYTKKMQVNILNTLEEMDILTAPSP